VKVRTSREIPLHFMLLPAVILVLIYSYGPMFGIVMSFQRFVPLKGFLHSPWVGMKNFTYMLLMPDFLQVLWNTVYIAAMKIALGILVPLVFALLINEVASVGLRRTLQTMIYLPHFLSWAILAGIFIEILSPSEGMVNRALGALGIAPVFFLGDPKAFPATMIGTETWKEFGFGTVIYFAAISGIDPSYYEAATIDGANRWKQTVHVTLPCLGSTIVILLVLSLGNVLNAGFEQVFNLYSPIVYSTGDIIDTLVYRIGLETYQYSLAAAVGLFKSVVSFILITASYALARRFANYRIF
jgi:putative aldouronate transport system permease protein